MKLTDWQRDSAIQDRFDDDEELFFWLSVGKDVDNWLDAQPAYIDPLIKWARANKVLMEEWKDKCVEYVDQMEE